MTIKRIMQKTALSAPIFFLFASFAFAGETTVSCAALQKLEGNLVSSWIKSQEISDEDVFLFEAIRDLRIKNQCKLEVSNEEYESAKRSAEDLASKIEDGMYR